MIRSILLNFLEYIGNLSQDATQAKAKLAHLETLFANAYHLLNEYRPHQARETLILMMEEQVAKRKAEIQGIKEMKKRIDELSAILPAMPADLDLANTSSEAKQNGTSTKRDQDAIWDALDEV